jgi:hypothetical protein
MKWVLPAMFVTVLVGHFFYSTRSLTVPSDGLWASYEFQLPEESRSSRYFGPGEHWLGLSYALAGTFAAWCFSRIVMLRNEALAASASGLTWSGFLWAGACFLTGCCGSPMLPLYLGLFGPQFVNVTKPLAFGITLVSIGAGYAWMVKRTPRRATANVNTGIHETVGANTSQV